MRPCAASWRSSSPWRSSSASWTWRTFPFPTRPRLSPNHPATSTSATTSARRIIKARRQGVASCSCCSTRESRRRTRTQQEIWDGTERTAVGRLGFGTTLYQTEKPTYRVTTEEVLKEERQSISILEALQEYYYIYKISKLVYLFLTVRHSSNFFI